MDWTDKQDNIIKDGIKQGLSTRMIAEILGKKVTRNMVLGRIFRQKLTGEFSKKYKPKYVHSTFGTRTKTKVRPEDVVEHIMDLKDLGMTWNEVSIAVGVSTPTARLWAIQYGGHDPIQRKRFTEEDEVYIAKAYSEHERVEDIADKLGRSYGVIRQKVLQLQRLGHINAYRDAQRTRLLRQYGAKALQVGKDPSDALHKIAEAKRMAFANAMVEARKAKTVFKQQYIEDMQADIAAGVDRNEAIFKARARGVTLQEISECFNITRERVRQICAKQAEIIALQKLVGED